MRDASGLSAVEFGLIAPLLAFLVLALTDAVNFGMAVTSMQRAERAGIQYFMNGGTDTGVVQGIVTAAWKNPPTHSSVSASEVCTCGGSSATCGTACADGSKMRVNMSVTASGTVRGMLTSFPESKTETVRVQ